MFLLLLLFLLFVYLSANILLVGAELAAEYPRVLRGDYDEEEAAQDGGGGSIGETVGRLVRGLFLHERDDAKPETSDSPEGKD